MVLLKWLLLASYTSCFFILPPVSPKRPNTARLSRGPVWTSFQALKLNETQLGTAKAEAAKRKRVAVVSNDADGKEGEVLVYAMLLTNELSYHPGLLVTDFVTSRQIFADCQSPMACAEAAANFKIDKVVWCTKEGNTLQAKIVDVSNRSALATLTDVNVKETWLDSVPQRQGELMERLGIDSPSRNRQSRSLPSRNITALIDLAKANVQTAALANMNDTREQMAGCRAALSVVEQAIKNDPNLIEAYILKASCQDELGDVAGVQKTLQDAFSRRDTSKMDPLTNLELEADYSRFCLNNIDTALERYTSMTEIDSANLRANWGIVDIILTGNGANRPGQEDLDEAAKFAAVIVSHHPQSAVANAINAQTAGK